jgi:hypothetical protein
MADKPNQDSYNQIIELIFENAQESIKYLDGEIKSLSTQLTAVTGFGAALIKFADDLPDRSIIPSSSLPCNICSILKILSLLLLSVSIFISLTGLLPKAGGEDQIISPTEQVEKCIDLSQAEYKLLFIEQYDRNIKSLNDLRIWKSKRLLWSGGFFVAATIVSALNLILSTGLKFLIDGVTIY